MENHFEAGIENLRQKLLVMASHTEKAVNDAVQAIVQRDHATNIAEDVVYLCEAQDIRHTGFKNQPAA